MATSATENLGHGITRIDAGYLKPGLACFYLLESNGEYAVVETGTQYSVPRLISLMSQRGIAPEAIRYVIPTHVHLDHAGGAGEMMSLFGNATLVVHPRGARHMVNPAKLVAASRVVYGDALFEQLYGEIRPVPESRVIAAADGHRIQLGGRELVFRDCPGHADHHFCIWDETSRGWFTGDVFGVSYQWCRMACGDFCMPSTTPTQFRPEALKASLALLGAAQPDTLYLTHYGALAYTSSKRELLEAQIDAYVALARDLGEDVDRLENAIMDYSLTQLAALDTGGDKQAWRDALQHDARLNAQGLAAWLQMQSL